MKKLSKIYLPHIHYTVHVKQMTVPPEGVLHAKAYVLREDENSCTVFLDKKKIVAGDLAHEIVHVLQFICGDRNINFVLEQEHTAYIMQYLMGKIMGYSWE
jgi:hypothetical protein